LQTLPAIANPSIKGLPAELKDLLMRESALALAQAKLKEARQSLLAERARLEGKPTLLQNLSSKSNQERESKLKAAINDLMHYDLQIQKAESLAALINKDVCRSSESYLKTSVQDYAAALATYDYPEDWARVSYNFELLIKSFQMGLLDLLTVLKREPQSLSRSPLFKDSIRKLLPISRQLEIDVEFFNRILTHRARQARGNAAEVALHADYSWCETTEQLGVQPADEALETLHELLAACSGFLANLGKAVRREQSIAEAKAARTNTPLTGTKASFLKIWWVNIKPAAALEVDETKLEALIDETKVLLMDGELTARFNRQLIQSIHPGQTHAPSEKPATTPPFQTDSELRALKTKLQAELEDMAKLKAGLTARERTLRDNEQQFSEKCKREQAALDEARRKLTALESEFALKARQADEMHAEELIKLEGLKAELAARSTFIEESEQRLLEKGQEQLEHLAELEQKDEELMTTKRELNAMRKEMGIPMIPLRAKPVNEFEE